MNPPIEKIDTPMPISREILSIQLFRNMSGSGDAISSRIRR